MTKHVFCLMGPTAIGKTDLACELTLSLPLEIINVDSSLMYKELNIGAAKPSDDVLTRFPHHLVNCSELSHIYSVAEFCKDVSRLKEEIWQRGHYPLLVGGTMMYFHALQTGLAKLPETNEKIRIDLTQQAMEKGWQFMHEQLYIIDPNSAKRIHPNDRQRILRGLEIYVLSGKTWTQWLQESGQSFDDTQWHNIAMMPDPRSWLHERIEQRLEIMIQQGFLNEVKHILALPSINLEHPALRSVGYRQAISFLLGLDTEQDWQLKALYATRQLAKRQITWLRGFEQKKVFLSPDQQIQIKILAWIKEILDNN
jgi:tRNA dimethylallyltransferase